MLFHNIPILHPTICRIKYRTLHYFITYIISYYRYIGTNRVILFHIISVFYPTTIPTVYRRTNRTSYYFITYLYYILLSTDNQIELYVISKLSKNIYYRTIHIRTHPGDRCTSFRQKTKTFKNLLFTTSRYSRLIFCC